MNLRRIRAGSAWTIYAVTSDRPDPQAPQEFECALLEMLKALANDARYGASVTRLNAQLDLIQHDRNGPAALRDNCHHICKAKVGNREVTIWQITAKDLRVLFFYDEGRVVVCSHAFPKQGQRTPDEDKERAKKACTQYFAMKAMKEARKKQ